MRTLLFHPWDPACPGAGVRNHWTSILRAVELNPGLRARSSSGGSASCVRPRSVACPDPLSISYFLQSVRA